MDKPVSRRLAALIYLSLALLLAGCERRNHNVRYEISGTAPRIALSYLNATGATEQRDVTSAWRLEFQAQTWTNVSITAFNPTSRGTVACRLYVDNVLVQQAESVGGYKWATCGALAGITNATPTPKK